MKWPPRWPPFRPSKQQRQEVTGASENDMLIDSIKHRLQQVQARLDALRAEAESLLPEKKR